MEYTQRDLRIIKAFQKILSNFSEEELTDEDLNTIYNNLNKMIQDKYATDRQRKRLVELGLEIPPYLTREEAEEMIREEEEHE